MHLLLRLDAWFHLNAASPAARNTEQVNITKDLVHARIRITNTARPPDYKSTIITTRTQLAWYISYDTWDNHPYEIDAGTTLKSGKLSLCERPNKYIRELSPNQTHVKYMPDNVPRKRMLSSTLFPNGLSRLGMWLNAESDDLNILSTPDTSPFFVTLMLSMNFPVSMRILL